MCEQLVRVPIQCGAMTSCSLRRLQELAGCGRVFGSVAERRRRRSRNVRTACQSANPMPPLTSRLRDDTVQRFAEDLEVR
jgi:hypothetical protein